MKNQQKRNPYAVPAAKRRAGTHEKPYKSRRQQEKVKLKKGDYRPFSFC